MLKRPRRASIDTPALPDPASPLRKRARFQSSPIRPKTSSTSFSTPSTHLKFRTPLSVPQDSPSNPFGLKRSLIALELPPPTSFSQHRTLRFQILDKGRKVGRDTRGGVFRVVQVPLSYTFRHIHKLILFLFATDIEINQVPSIKKAMKGKTAGVTRRRRASSAAGTASAKGKGKSKGKGKARAEVVWGGHWFEVMENVVMDPAVTKPGAIGEGSKTWIKASSIRDRRLFKDVFGPQGFSEDDSPNPLDEDEPENGAWKWEAEDDLTLGTVWPDEPDQTKGIIYHHSPMVSVHMTLNTLPVEHRRGRGNTPHIFSTKGSSAGLIRITHTKLNEYGLEGAPDENDTNDATGIPDPDTQMKRWNEVNAFADFLSAEADRERALRRRSSPSPPFSSPSTDIPTLLYDDRSSSVTAEMLASSDDPAPIPSEFESELEVEADLTRYSDSVLFPYAYSAITPYPANPLRQRRVQCAERRLSRLTARGMRAVMSDDEEDARKRARKKEKRKQRAKEKEREEEEKKARIEAEREEDDDDDDDRDEESGGDNVYRGRGRGRGRDEEEEEEEEEEQEVMEEWEHLLWLQPKPRTQASEKEEQDRQRIQRMLSAGAAAAKGPQAKHRTARIWREWENDDDVELDEAGNVRDLLGIYEAEV